MVKAQSVESASGSEATDQSENIPHQAGPFVALVFFVCAIVLLIVAPFATRAQPVDKPWFMAPVNGPVFALLVMAIPAAILAWRWWKNYKLSTDKNLYIQNSTWAFRGMLPAVEYCIYFCAYLWLINYAGFALSTLLFGQVCLYRSGLRGIGWVCANIAFTVVLVLLLRVMLGLWFPMAPLFGLLPKDVGNLLGQYL